MTQSIDQPPTSDADQPGVLGDVPAAGPPAPAAYAPTTPSPYAAPAPYAAGPPLGAPGTIRSTGVCMLLAVVTLGFYTWYWYYSVHEEMKRHSGQGLGGGLGLVLAVFLSFVSPFIASAEVGALYARAGKQPPVTGLTGLWYVPGMIILVGPIVWFVKTNGALNDYWRSQGVAA